MQTIWVLGDQVSMEHTALTAANPGDSVVLMIESDRAGALRWLRYFIDERLPTFGAFEDMMAEGEPFISHSVLSPWLNLGLLHPREGVEAAIDGPDACPYNYLYWDFIDQHADRFAPNPRMRAIVAAGSNARMQTRTSCVRVRKSFSRSMFRSDA